MNGDKNRCVEKPVAKHFNSTGHSLENLSIFVIKKIHREDSIFVRPRKATGSGFSDCWPQRDSTMIHRPHCHALPTCLLNTSIHKRYVQFWSAPRHFQDPCNPGIIKLGVFYIKEEEGKGEPRLKTSKGHLSSLHWLENHLTKPWTQSKHHRQNNLFKLHVASYIALPQIITALLRCTITIYKNYKTSIHGKGATPHNQLQKLPSMTANSDWYCTSYTIDIVRALLIVTWRYKSSLCQQNTCTTKLWECNISRATHFQFRLTTHPATCTCVQNGWTGLVSIRTSYIWLLLTQGCQWLPGYLETVLQHVLYSPPITSYMYMCLSCWITVEREIFGAKNFHLLNFHLILFPLLWLLNGK